MRFCVSSEGKPTNAFFIAYWPNPKRVTPFAESLN